MSRARQTKEMKIAAAKDAFRIEVKVQRIHHDMTQGELAKYADVHPSVMCGLLADPDKISVGRLRKIIEALDLNPTTILNLLYDEYRW